MNSGQLNEINLTGNTWLAADIHLGADIPLTAKAFYGFLALARDNVHNLILCGDIFDSWIGDDNAIKAKSPWLQQAITELQFTAQKINLFLMPGNRDFLIGDKLANYLGANLLGSPTRLILNERVLLIAHGDEYCTDDKPYQRFRRIVHNPIIQKLFLSLPLGVRRKIAVYARHKSKHAHSKKSAAIMDVNHDAIDSAMISAETVTMIHGHTHRPYRHEFKLGQELALRYVLPDWDYDNDHRGGWLSIIDGTLEMHYYRLN